MSITLVRTLTPRRLMAVLALSFAMFLGAASAAQAWQGGWDRDHLWIKVSRAEIASGTAGTACTIIAGRYAPPLRALCPALAAAASRSVGRAGGVWGEIYRTGRIRYGTY